eukprot:3025950-Rhodomonas_salina.1
MRFLVLDFAVWADGSAVGRDLLELLLEHALLLLRAAQQLLQLVHLGVQRLLLVRPAPQPRPPSAPNLWSASPVCSALSAPRARQPTPALCSHSRVCGSARAVGLGVWGSRVQVAQTCTRPGRARPCAPSAAAGSRRCRCAPAASASPSPAA